MSNQSNIEKAKAFLRKRLNAEQSASNNLSAKLTIFANLILQLYNKYGYTPDSPLAKLDEAFKYELEQLVRRFKDELYSDIELLCVSANQDDRDKIIALINMNIFGQTLTQRIDFWTASFLTYVQSSINQGIKSFSRIAIITGPAYGLDRLTRQTITDAYMNEWKEQHPNATGFIPHRGSSYPCDLCDEHAEHFHPMSEYPSYGNWHVNCMCFFEFVTTPSPVPH